MTSVERINEYASLEKEESSSSKLKPKPGWPENGEIVFDDVCFAYDKNLPAVLKNVTFKLNAREKIGVVGRTGAGKSTIFQTLFRMAEPQGTVTIDGINIKDVSLADLRNKMSIIPVSIKAIKGLFRSLINILARANLVHGAAEVQFGPVRRELR